MNTKEFLFRVEFYSNGQIKCWASSDLPENPPVNSYWKDCKGGFGGTVTAVSGETATKKVKYECSFIPQPKHDWNGCICGIDRKTETKTEPKVSFAASRMKIMEG